MFDDRADFVALQRSVADYFKKKVGDRGHIWEAQGYFDADVIRGMGDMGLWGIVVPQTYGGAGLGYREYALIVEEVSRFDGSLGLSVAAHNSLAVGHLLLAGTSEQKDRYLPSLARGESLGAWALTEPEAGSDAGGVRTRARKEAKGWILEGRKIFVTHGSSARHVVVLARTETDLRVPASCALTAFVVPTDAEGVRVVRKVEKVGMKACDTAELEFDQVVLADEDRLGAVGSGFRDAMAILDRGRIGIAALAVGIGASAVELAIGHASQRKQFGKTVGRFQGVQRLLADSWTELEAARLLTEKAAALAHAGQPFSRAAAMAKLFASEAGSRASDHALQVFGGYGYTTEYALERKWRDVRLCEIGEGTSEILRMVIARSLIAERQID